MPVAVARSGAGVIDMTGKGFRGCLIGAWATPRPGGRRWMRSGQGPFDPIFTLDDANSEIILAFLAKEEGTASSFAGLVEQVQAKGLPCVLYSDRARLCFHTPQAGGKVDKTKLSQVCRALFHGTRRLASYSAQGTLIEERKEAA